MGTALGRKYLPYTYLEPLGTLRVQGLTQWGLGMRDSGSLIIGFRVKRLGFRDSGLGLKGPRTPTMGLQGPNAII